MPSSRWCDVATGLGVDLHPYYQRGTSALPGVEYGWLKMCDGAAVYTKTAAGVEYTADTHAALFRRLGIPFGGYVYAQPGDGAAEARVLWAECQRLGGTGIAPGCDLESNKDIHIWSPAEAKDHGRAYASQMRKLGVRPAIYSDLTLLQAIDPTSWPEDPVIWAPRYGRRPEADGKYTRGYDVHQYDDAGSLPGSAGAVDWNQSYQRGTTITPGAAQLAPVSIPAPPPSSSTEEEDVSSDEIVGTGVGDDQPFQEMLVPVNGHRYLRIAIGWGDTAILGGISLVDDTPGAAGSHVVTVQQGGVASPDRPGPWDLHGAGGDNYGNYSHVALLVKAPAGSKVKAWTNDRP